MPSPTAFRVPPGTFNYTPPINPGNVTIPLVPKGTGYVPSFAGAAPTAGAGAGVTVGVGTVGASIAAGAVGFAAGSVVAAKLGIEYPGGLNAAQYFAQQARKVQNNVPEVWGDQGAGGTYEAEGPPPFTGGQGAGVLYNVSYQVTWAFPTLNGNQVMVGPIGGSSMTTTINDLGNKSFAFFITGGNGKESVTGGTTYANDNPKGFITGVSRADGQPDLDGNPKGDPMPTPRPNPPINFEPSPDPFQSPNVPPAAPLPTAPPAPGAPTQYKQPNTGPNIAPAPPLADPLDNPNPNEQNPAFPGPAPAGPLAPPAGPSSPAPTGKEAPDGTQKVKDGSDPKQFFFPPIPGRAVKQEDPPPNCGCNKPIMDALGGIADRLGGLFGVGAEAVSTKVIMDRLDAMQEFASGAWQSTQIQKAIDVLTLITTLHNAYYLSQDVALTVGEVASLLLDVVGIDDESGNPLDVNNIVANTVKNALNEALGETLVTNVSNALTKANRVYQSASNVINSVQNIGNSIADVAEVAANNTGKIGNALKDSGVVDKLSYPYLSENVQASDQTRRKMQRIIDNIEQADDKIGTLYAAVSSVKEIQDQVAYAKEAKDQLKNDLENLAPKEDVPENKPVKDAATAASTASTPPISQPSDLDPADASPN